MLIIKRHQTDPYFNLAAEEYILKNYGEDSFMLWRNEPSIIVGKHQNTLAEINIEYVNDNKIKVVRRLSGGGAVFHDLGNINFTFIRHGEPGTLVDFRKFTQPILEVMQKLGIQARFEGRNDLTIDGRKFSGNAEHVFKDRVLHHGTLLFSSVMADLTGALKVDPSKFSDKAVKSVRSRVTNISEHLKEPMEIEAFMKLVTDHVHEMYPDARVMELSEDDHINIRKLVDQKYSGWDWNFGYSPAYDFRKNIKTSNGGHIEMNLQAENGMITAVRIFGDYFSRKETAELESALVGLPHTMDAIEQLANQIEIDEYFAHVTRDEFITLFF
ncbi:MAG: lipoate--protein ligase [Bacteroidales bacterium]|nr:lipoate--protein ligase [Bacteroidales bacterium]